MSLFGAIEKHEQRAEKLRETLSEFATQTPDVTLKELHRRCFELHVDDGYEMKVELCPPLTCLFVTVYHNGDIVGDEFFEHELYGHGYPRKFKTYNQVCDEIIRVRDIINSLNSVAVPASEPSLLLTEATSGESTTGTAPGVASAPVTTTDDSSDEDDE